MGQGGHQKSRGPNLAHGSGSSGRRSCRLRSSSRWAQISRLPGRRRAPRAGEGGSSSSSSRRLLVSRSVRATCEPVGSLRVARNRCQPSSEDDVAPATDDVGSLSARSFVSEESTSAVRDRRPQDQTHVKRSGLERGGMSLLSRADSRPSGGRHSSPRGSARSQAQDRFPGPR